MTNNSDNRHPRDRFITVFGKKPVLEALENPDVNIACIYMVRMTPDTMISAIKRTADHRGIDIIYKSGVEINRLSKNPKQDQGIVADIETPNRAALDNFLEAVGTQTDLRLIVLDGITTPANVGMIIRVATGLGVNGIVLPRQGASSINPLVIKASAGVVFQAPVLSCDTPEAAAVLLKENRFTIFGMDMAGDDVLDIGQWPERAAIVMGGETDGLSRGVVDKIDRRIKIPMRDGIESLNVATAAAIACWEMMKRK